MVYGVQQKGGACPSMVGAVHAQNLESGWKSSDVYRLGVSETYLNFVKEQVKKVKDLRISRSDPGPCDGQTGTGRGGQTGLDKVSPQRGNVFTQLIVCRLARVAGAG